MQVTPQSQQYGLPGREARGVPPVSEVAGLLGGVRIPTGTMRRHEPSESVRPF